VEFSKRIAVIAGVATWGCVVLGLVAATVWNFGSLSPMAQMSRRTGFLMPGDDEASALLDTGPNWEAALDPGHAPNPAPPSAIPARRFHYAAGPGERGRAAVPPTTGCPAPPACRGRGGWVVRRRRWANGTPPAMVLALLARGRTNKFLHGPTQALNQAGDAERAELVAMFEKIYRIPDGPSER